VKHLNHGGHEIDNFYFLQKIMLIAKFCMKFFADSENVKKIDQMGHFLSKITKNCPIAQNWSILVSVAQCSNFVGQ